MAKKHIAVIGAGSSGLAAIKCCLDEGLVPTCFEKTNGYGGLWNYHATTTDGLANIMISTVTNDSKDMMSYSDFPAPANFPVYCTGETFMGYLTMYAEKFDLVNHIQLNTEVLKVEQASDYTTTGRWTVRVQNNTTNTATSHTFDGVIVCVGVHGKSFCPTFKGQEEFKGQITHIHDLRSLAEFRNKRVVVVGMGNSGGDACVEIGKIASQVYLSPREVPWVIRRCLKDGIPADMVLLTRLNMFLSRWPSLLNYIFESYFRAYYNPAWFGLNPNKRILSTETFINDEILDQITFGNVVVQRMIKHLTPSSVVFDDGTEVKDIDAIVFATGYRIHLPFLDKSILDVQDNKVDLYRGCFPAELAHPSLALVGCLHSLGPFVPVLELQSRWIAQVFKGQHKFPSIAEMQKEINHENTERRKAFGDTMKYGMAKPWMPYVCQLGEMIGCKPNLWRMLVTDPCLAWQCFFGPFLPYQNRLTGPGKWSGARDAIMQVWDRVLPYNKNGAVLEKSSCCSNSLCCCSNSFYVLLFFLVILMALLVKYMM